jgi:cell division transport system permease protein
MNDTLENFKNQKYVNALSLLTIIFTFFVINIFFFLKVNIGEFTDKFASEYRAEIFLKGNNISKNNRLMELIKSEPLIKKYVFTDSRQAKNSFLKNFPELKQTVEDIGENPFPSSIRVYFKNRNRKIINSFIDKYKNYKSVKEIKTNLLLIDKLKGAQKVVIITGLFFGSILLFTSFFTIVNIIKIVAYSRKEEVSILKMVGASNFYIELPLILNGIILGVVGALISVILFEITLMILPYYLKGFYDFIRPLIGTNNLSAKFYFYLILIAGFVGGFSSYTSVAKFLRKEE